MRLVDLLPRLESARPRGNGRYSAKCPAHDDKSPSLSIQEGERGILLHCFSGCALTEICASLDLKQRDLFFDAPVPRRQRPMPAKPVKIDRVKLAFQCELSALDLRLRADRIIEAGKNLRVANLNDDELDLAIAHAMQAHVDVERAELFEGVADTLRERDYSERNTRERQERVA